MKRILKALKNPKLALLYLLGTKLGRIFSDKTYLKIKYRIVFGKKLNLKEPKTFNEKLQWLKLNDRKPQYTTMVDKYEAKKYIADRIGEQYVIPTIGVWDSFDDIDFDKLPDKFVLKCTHNSQGLVICRDKQKLDYQKIRKEVAKSLKNNFYWHCREWQYKNVVPRVMVEQYMEDSKGVGRNLNVFKIFCFNGEPKLFQVIQNDKTKEETIDYFDVSWNRLDIRQNYPNSETHLKRPVNLEQMLEIAKKLSEGFPFLRVDLYEVNGKIYFSELTFHSDAGFAKFQPEEWDFNLGNFINIS